MAFIAIHAKPCTVLRRLLSSAARLVQNFACIAIVSGNAMIARGCVSSCQECDSLMFGEGNVHPFVGALRAQPVTARSQTLQAL